MIKMYCNNYPEWREAISEYLLTNEVDAKKGLLRLFYGGLPACDLPFLRTMRAEIEQAVDIILNIEKY